jgi:hypothetical protein
LRAVLIDHVEKHEFFFGVGARSLRHDGAPQKENANARNSGLMPDLKMKMRMAVFLRASAR